jgi:transcriptional regulator with XRE-family HTH domain
MDAAEEALAIVRVRAWLRSGRAREVRKRSGLSQSDVGRAVGTDHAQVSRWESGMYAPRRDSALALARLYGELEKAVLQEEGEPAGG